MFYNNLLSIPVLLVGTFALEDWSKENLQRNFPVETQRALLIGMIYSGLMAVFISYSSAWCIRVTSSTTYSMVGALNKLPIAISGLVFFDAPVTFGSVSAVFIASVSGIAYAWGKNLEKERKNLRARVEEEEDGVALLPTVEPRLGLGKRDDARS
jgi:GDP-mannose transporter